MSRRKLKNFFLPTLFLWLAMHAAQAQELWLQNIPIKQLQTLYEKSGYDGIKGYLRIPDRKYPAIFLKNFPSDYASVTDEEKRNALFFKILAPLALKLNQELLQERSQIEDMAGSFETTGTLSEKQQKQLEEKAAKYDVFSRLKGSDRYAYIISELLNRIDQIPPSIMLTAAALETNWGTSRIVTQGNSLYKTLVWHTNDGLKPLGETEDATYRIKTYPDIYASMQDFALKINSHKSFEVMRNMRRERRTHTSNMSGPLMAPYVYGTSALNNYAGIFDYTLAYYELLEIDKSSLDSNMIPEAITKDYAKYVTKM